MSLFYRSPAPSYKLFKPESDELQTLLEKRYGSSFILDVDEDWEYLNGLSDAGIEGAKELNQLLVEDYRVEVEIS